MTTTTLIQSNEIKKEINNFFHQKIADLIYHEGPLLGLFCDEEKNAFLYKWVDCDKEKNSWVVFNVTNQQFSDLLNRVKSLRELCLEISIYILLEIGDDLEINTSSIILSSSMPKQFLPFENSHYNKSIYTECAETLKNLFNCNVIQFNNEQLDLANYLKNKFPESEIHMVDIIDFV